MGEKGKREEMLRNYATLPNSARVAQCRKSHQPSRFHGLGVSVISNSRYNTHLNVREGC